MVAAEVLQMLVNWRRNHARQLVTALVAVTVPALIAVATALAQGTRTSATGAPGGSCPWVISTAPISQRVAQLMSQMSVSNEISMVEGHGTSNPYVFYTPAISSLCIPAFGLRMARPGWPMD